MPIFYTLIKVKDKNKKVGALLTFDDIFSDVDRIIVFANKASVVTKRGSDQSVVIVAVFDNDVVEFGNRKIILRKQNVTKTNTKFVVANTQKEFIGDLQEFIENQLCFEIDNYNGLNTISSEDTCIGSNYFTFFLSAKHIFFVKAFALYALLKYGHECIRSELQACVALIYMNCFDVDDNNFTVHDEQCFDVIGEHLLSNCFGPIWKQYYAGKEVSQVTFNMYLDEQAQVFAVKMTAKKPNTDLSVVESLIRGQYQFLMPATFNLTLR